MARHCEYTPCTDFGPWLVWLAWSLEGQVLWSMSSVHLPNLQDWKSVVGEPSAWLYPAILSKAGCCWQDPRLQKGGQPTEYSKIVVDVLRLWCGAKNPEHDNFIEHVTSRLAASLFAGAQPFLSVLTVTNWLQRSALQQSGHLGPPPFFHPLQ